LIGDQKIELTNKEADLLLLLHKTVNEAVTREVILNMVWGDEGDYVGRTLDVFISKLRKKLATNPSAKIITIRGVGYKLVID
jgi:DNA-binding response OmpR family regulator